MPTEIVVSYPVTREEIEETRARFAAVTFSTPTAYAEGVKAIAHCRGTRGKIEERRKALKADSLDYGRRVDRVAKELTALVESIERPMRDAKHEVDTAKARAKAEKEAAERAAIEAQLRADREAEEKRIAEERAKLEAQQAELRAERERFERERMAAALPVAPARGAITITYQGPVEVEELELGATGDSPDRIDRASLSDLVSAIRGLHLPTVQGAQAQAALQLVTKRLARTADELEQWVVSHGA